MPLPAESSDTKESAKGSPLEVMVVDEWLIFDCPGCGQTIKLDRKDSVHDIECPSCNRGFEPLLDREVKLPPLKGPARKRARRRGPRSEKAESEEEVSASKTGALIQSRPTSSSLPDEGIVKLTLTPTRNVPEEADLSSALPVRSALELERRRVESLDGKQTRQPDESELNAVIEEQSGGNYKRIRVRTRKKRLTEKQRALRMYLFGGIAALMVVIFSFWGAAQFYKDDSDAEADTLGGEIEVYADSDPIGAKLGHHTNVINELKSATTVDQLLKLIRYPKRLEPTLIAFYGDRPVPAPTVRDVVTATKVSVTLPKNFLRLRLVLPKKEIPIYMEKTKDFGYRLDWESYVGLSEIPWEAFVDQQVTRTVSMRAYALASQKTEKYFEPPFSKDRHYCVRLEDPDGKYPLYGYYERANPKLPPFTEFLFKAGTKVGVDEVKDLKVPIILDVRFPKGAKNKVQIEIVDFVKDTWLKP